MGNMEKAFDSIYRDYDKWKMIVGSVVGYDSAFVDVIISDSILNLLNKLRDGSTRLESISTNGNIHYNYFKSTIIRKAIDHIRRETDADGNRRMVCPEFMPVEECYQDDLEYEEGDDAIERLDQIKDILTDYEKTDCHSKFHSDVFKYFYFDGININQLSKATGINRRALTTSKNLVINILNNGKEKKENNQRIAN